MVDRYTKSVLTVIAVALLMLATQQMVPGATAQSGGALQCGEKLDKPCFVTIVYWDQARNEVVLCGGPKAPCYVRGR